MAFLHLISAGAAKGLVQAVQREFEAGAGVTIDGRFGAVGAMKEELLAGEPCDAVILTQAMLEQLAADGMVVGESIRPVGRVYTGIAIPAGSTRPHIHDAEALKAALLHATAIYLPDPQRATAGIHFANVLAKLGIHDAVAARLRPFPNGANAMRAMADGRDAQAIGCTQVTEILYTSGVELVGVLPKEFELATLYSAATCPRAQNAPAAARLIDLLCGDGTRSLRQVGGFEPV